MRTALCVGANDRGRVQTILPLSVCLAVSALAPSPRSLVVHICQGSISSAVAAISVTASSHVK